MVIGEFQVSNIFREIAQVFVQMLGLAIPVTSKTLTLSEASLGVRDSLFKEKPE